MTTFTEVFTERERKENLYMARILACHRLRNQGMTLRAIGQSLGISHEHVRNLLAIDPDD